MFPVWEFVVWRGTPGDTPDNTSISALPLIRSNHRLCCGIFRTELAISRHGWFFTTKHTSHERIALSTVTGIHHSYERLLLAHVLSPSFKLPNEDSCYSSVALLLHFDYDLIAILILPPSSGPWLMFPNERTRSLPYGVASLPSAIDGLTDSYFNLVVSGVFQCSIKATFQLSLTVLSSLSVLASI